MNLLLDMGVSPRTGDFLRGRGYDVVHLRDRGLSRLPDPDVLQLAESESRTIVTFDLDFSRLLALRHLACPSVILIRMERFTTDQMNRLLPDLLSRYAEELIAGAIIVVDAFRIRVRRLPIL